MPSYDKTKSGFSPLRCWRGPVWISINWSLYHGLRAHGFHDYAGHVRQAILSLSARGGMYGYFGPDTGEGHGAASFSWTAALFLDVAHEYGGRIRHG